MFIWKIALIETPNNLLQKNTMTTKTHWNGNNGKWVVCVCVCVQCHVSYVINNCVQEQGLSPQLVCDLVLVSLFLRASDQENVILIFVWLGLLYTRMFQAVQALFSFELPLLSLLLLSEISSWTSAIFVPQLTSLQPAEPETCHDSSNEC